MSEGAAEIRIGRGKGRLELVDLSLLRALDVVPEGAGGASEGSRDHAGEEKDQPEKADASSVTVVPAT